MPPNKSLQPTSSSSLRSSAASQEQLVEWIRDCLAFCDGTRGDEQRYNESLEELRVLFEEYLRRFPGQPLTGEDVLH